MANATAENSITIVGNLVDDPELSYLPSGVAVANLRVAVNRRVRNRDTNEWEDALDGYFRVNVWRDQAENVAESLQKGDRVLVRGALKSRSYEDREGQTRWVTEIEADEVTPSLRWATAKVSRRSRRSNGGGNGGGNSGGGGWGSGGDDWGGGGWGDPPPTSDDVPF